MTRYCTVDRNEITDAKRLARNSPYCSDDCQKKAKAERRERRGACRMCGRGMTTWKEERSLSRGFMGMADPASHGYTNIAVLKQRIDEARAALNPKEAQDGTNQR